MLKHSTGEGEERL